MMKVSVSKLNAFNRCHKMYAYRYNDKIEKNKPNIKLVRGVILHECLENLYLGLDWTLPITKYSTELSKEPKEIQDEFLPMISDLYRIMKGYILNFRDIDTGLKILAVEKPFEVEIGQTLDGTPIVYEGIIDLIYEDSEGVWICDHKTVTTIPDDSIRYLDAQTNLYFHAAKSLGYDPQGVVFNYLRTKAPSIPKTLKNGTISKAACDTDVMTFLATLKSAGQDLKDYDDIIKSLESNMFYKRIRVPRPDKLVASMVKEFVDGCSMIEKSSLFGLFPRTINKNCSWDCEYCDLCFAEISGVNVDYTKSAYYRPRESRNGDELDGNNKEEQ